MAWVGTSCLIIKSKDSVNYPELGYIFFLNPISSLVIGGDTANPLLPIWLAIPTIAVLTYVCTVIVSKIISLVPGSKWIIG